MISCPVDQNITRLKVLLLGELFLTSDLVQILIFPECDVNTLAVALKDKVKALEDQLERLILVLERPHKFSLCWVGG